MTQQSRDTIPPASVTGRIGKLLVGLLQIQGAVSVVLYFAQLTEATWNPGLWVFVALAFTLVSFNIRLGLHRVLPVGNAPAGIALLAGGVLSAVQWLQTGALWGSTTATFALALTVGVHLHMGISHVLAAVIGLPGCEMRVIPHLLSRARGGGASRVAACPGIWTPVDRWEERLRGSSHRAGS